MKPSARRSLDEGTARFIFQAATGFGFFCILAALLLGIREAQVGGAIFLVLALLSLGATVYYGRVYLRLRQERWTRELERPQQALEQLFDRARVEREAPEEDGDHA